MASTDLSTNSAQHSGREDQLDGNHTETKLANDLVSGVDGVFDVGRGSVGRSRDASPASSGSGLSSTKGGVPSPVSSTSGAPPLSMPHPKKFSHVNISRKFLEKTTSTPAHTLSSSPVSKTANPSHKPASQATTPHSRLVTAKLTATPQPGSTGGWSRPSSVVPTATPTPIAGPNLKPPPAPAGAVPLPSPMARVIHPQPRSNQDILPLKKDASGKPVWGVTKGGNGLPLDRVPTDFPTAAEVAQASDRNLQPDAAAAHKQAVMAELMAEEDTFRGVHLDPNAHHWDEMEEDDDNFLGGVIEFGDGRQYKVQSTDAPRHVSPPRDPSKLLPPGEVVASAPNAATDQPVSKEERFADDFDRSWPRSRPGPHAISGHQFGGASSPSSISVPLSQESSRVLFNERSNRLEPYSHQRHPGPGVPQHSTRRSSRSDYSLSPTEGRRDAPPHTQLHSVQLLQKGPNGTLPHPESPTFSRAPGDRSPISPPDASRFRDRPPMRRDHLPWQANGVHGPDSSRAGAYGSSHPSHRSPRDGPFDDRTRRPPASEPLTSGLGGDPRRQLPPHLSATASHIPSGRTEDGPPRSPIQPLSSLPQSEPPVPSASSQSAESPAAPASTLPVSDLEEVRKAAMHTAAERARLRRQQEEEEREKEKERAHRKAAEIEERMKAAEQAKAQQANVEKKTTEAQVLGIIEEAVSSVSLHEKIAGPVNGLHEGISQPAAPVHSAMGRAPSSGGTSRLLSSRRTSLTSSAVTPSVPADTDTWRRKNPPPGATAQQDILPNTLVPPPTVLTHTDLEVKEGEDVDVVDFADLGKLVGSEPSHPAGARPSRAVASDYLNDDSILPQRQAPPLPPSKADEGPWRRRPSIVVDQTRPPPPENSAECSTSEDVHLPVHSSSPTDSSGASGPPFITGVSQLLPSEDHHRRVSGHYQTGVHKQPPGPHYREAPMSTLNDVMARIKGALDGMHHEADVPKETPKSQKWLPPALRPRPVHLDFVHPTEVFDVTAVEPPHSPKRAWNIFTVKLSHDTRPIPPPPTGLDWPRGRRQMSVDVYSWTSVDALNRRDTTSSEYLFGRPRLYKGQTKYFIKLPRTRITRRSHAEGTPVPPIVNLPNTPPRPRNAPSKETSTSSWRKPAVFPPSGLPLSNSSGEGLGLDTVSRSPPPEAPSTKAPAPGLGLATATPSRPQQLKPSGVAFYQTTPIERSGESQAAVQFLVSSELESESKPGTVTSEPKSVTALASIGVAPATTTIPMDTRSEASSNTVARELTLPWSKSPKVMSIKDSPARAPDPEHLKAVWSQTPDKAQIQPVNSLKGIVDDLTSVPFSLQDVKSDDGETPPPSGSGPWTRMSAYEVTRAFQQVPSSSSSSSQRPQPIAPVPSLPIAYAPSANGVTPPNPMFAFSPPPIGQNGLRQAYPAYSPMLSAPSPNVMYSQPSPVPRPMVLNGGAPPVYGQPVWMPAMPGPPPSQSGGVMRSPYPAQLIPYPPPSGPVPMYPSPMHPSPQQNGVQSRSPGGLPLVSPVMQPALPQMYAGSPVLVHAPPVMNPGQPYPVPVPPNRESMRAYGSPATPHMPSPMRQPPQNGYNPVPSSYPRPPW